MWDSYWIWLLVSTFLYHIFINILCIQNWNNKERKRKKKIVREKRIVIFGKWLFFCNAISDYKRISSRLCQFGIYKSHTQVHNNLEKSKHEIGARSDTHKCAYEEPTQVFTHSQVSLWGAYPSTSTCIHTLTNMHMRSLPKYPDTHKCPMMSLPKYLDTHKCPYEEPIQVFRHSQVSHQEPTQVFRHSQVCIWGAYTSIQALTINHTINIMILFLKQFLYLF